jgi:hypothetical protein
VLDIRIPITLGTIATLKRELAETIGDVKSSHRIEATARALGFRTYASMLDTAKTGHGVATTTANGATFRCYLDQHGFNVEAIHLYRALARVAVCAVLEVNPRLSMRGYGFGPRDWNSDLKRFETPQEQYAQFTSDRAEFLSPGGFDEFLLALAFVQRIPATKTVRGVGSYRLKHIAENMPFTTADGTTIGPQYVSNGALIAAALSAGFKMKTYVDQRGYDAINVSFNMSKRVIDDLDCEYRPDGAEAQRRAHIEEQRGYPNRFWPR